MTGERYQIIWDDEHFTVRQDGVVFGKITPEGDFSLSVRTAPPAVLQIMFYLTMHMEEGDYPILLDAEVLDDGITFSEPTISA